MITEHAWYGKRKTAYGRYCKRRRRLSRFRDQVDQTVTSPDFFGLRPFHAWRVGRILQLKAVFLPKSLKCTETALLHYRNLHWTVRHRDSRAGIGKSFFQEGGSSMILGGFGALRPMSIGARSTTTPALLNALGDPVNDAIWREFDVCLLKTSMSVSVSRAGIRTDDVQTSIRAHLGSRRPARPVEAQLFLVTRNATRPSVVHNILVTEARIDLAGFPGEPSANAPFPCLRRGSAARSL